MHRREEFTWHIPADPTEPKELRITTMTESNENPDQAEMKRNPMTGDICKVVRKLENILLTITAVESSPGTLGNPRLQEVLPNVKHLDLSTMLGIEELPARATVIPMPETEGIHKHCMVLKEIFNGLQVPPMLASDWNEIQDNRHCEAVVPCYLVLANVKEKQKVMLLQYNWLHEDCRRDMQCRKCELEHAADRSRTLG